MLITSSIGGLGSGRGRKEGKEKSAEVLAGAFTGVSPPSFLGSTDCPYDILKLLFGEVVFTIGNL